MNGELRRALLLELDKYAMEVQADTESGNIAELVKPELERLSKENNVDMVDLFVAYMDHVAKSSKAMSPAGDNTDIDFEKPDLRLY